MSLLQRISFQANMAIATATFGVTSALAQFGGQVPDIPGTPDASPGASGIRETVTRILITVLNFLALVAVIFVIIGGIRLIVSQGEEEQKEKAKKTILYVVIGLIVILFARVIVGFITSNPIQDI